MSDITLTRTVISYLILAEAEKRCRGQSPISFILPLKYLHCGINIVRHADDLQTSRDCVRLYRVPQLLNMYIAAGIKQMKYDSRKVGICGDLHHLLHSRLCSDKTRAYNLTFGTNIKISWLRGRSPFIDKYINRLTTVGPWRTSQCMREDYTQSCVYWHKNYIATCMHFKFNVSIASCEALACNWYFQILKRCGTHFLHICWSLSDCSIRVFND